MKVYYDSGIWHKGTGIHGVKQKVNWRFEHADMRCVIPAIYRFPKGIVFDILLFTDEAKLHRFFEQYPTEETLTSNQRRCAQEEHPLQPVPVQEIWLNGKLAESGVSYSHIASATWARGENELGTIRKAYPAFLRDTPSFACQRVCMAYPEANHRIEPLLRRLRLNRIRSIRLATGAAWRFYPLDICFELPVGIADKQIEFINPPTGAAHRLYFSKTEIHEFPFGSNTSRKLYTMLAQYEIDPALPQGSTINFNSSISCPQNPQVDFPHPITPSERFKMIEDTLEEEDSGPCKESPASIGIIGGADGPTAIFVGTVKREQPEGPHGFPLHTGFSVPAFVKKNAYAFTIDGLSVKHIDENDYLLGDIDTGKLP